MDVFLIVAVGWNKWEFMSLLVSFEGAGLYIWKEPSKFFVLVSSLYAKLSTYELSGIHLEFNNSNKKVEKNVIGVRIND